MLGMKRTSKHHDHVEINTQLISCYNEGYGRCFMPSNGPLASMSDYKNKWDESFGSDRFF